MDASLNRSTPTDNYVTIIFVYVLVMTVAAPTMCLLARSSWLKGWTKLWWECVSMSEVWWRSHLNSPTEKEDTVCTFECVPDSYQPVALSHVTDCLERRYHICARSLQRLCADSCLSLCSYYKYISGRANHNKQRSRLDIYKSVKGRGITAFDECSDFYSSGVSGSKEEVGCSQASMLNDVRGTSQTRKQSRGSCSGFSSREC